MNLFFSRIFEVEFFLIFLKVIIFFLVDSSGFMDKFMFVDNFAKDLKCLFSLYTLLPRLIFVWNELWICGIVEIYCGYFFVRVSQSPSLYHIAVGEMVWLYSDLK